MALEMGHTAMTGVLAVPVIFLGRFIGEALRAVSTGPSHTAEQDGGLIRNSNCH
jgi:hypothetical protein